MYADKLGVTYNSFVSLRLEGATGDGCFLSAKPGGHLGFTRTLAENETFLLRPVRRDPNNNFVITRIFTFWHKTCLATAPPDRQQQIIGALGIKRSVLGPVPVVHIDPDEIEQKGSRDTYGHNPMFLWEVKKDITTQCHTIRPLTHAGHFLSGHQGIVKIHPELGIHWNLPVCKRFTFNQGVLTPKHPPPSILNTLLYILSPHDTPMLVTAGQDGLVKLVRHEVNDEVFVIVKRPGIGRVSIQSARWNSLLIAKQDGSIVHLPHASSTVAGVGRAPMGEDELGQSVEVQSIFTAIHDEKADTWVFITCFGTRLTHHPNTGMLVSTGHPLDRWCNWTLQMCTRDSKQEEAMLINMETVLLRKQNCDLNSSSSLCHQVFCHSHQQRLQLGPPPVRNATGQRPTTPSSAPILNTSITDHNSLERRRASTSHSLSHSIFSAFSKTTSVESYKHHQHGSSLINDEDTTQQAVHYNDKNSKNNTFGKDNNNAFGELNPRPRHPGKLSTLPSHFEGDRWTVEDSNMYKCRMRQLLDLVDMKRQEDDDWKQQVRHTEAELHDRTKTYKDKVRKYIDASQTQNQPDVALHHANSPSEYSTINLSTIQMDEFPSNPDHNTNNKGFEDEEEEEAEHTDTLHTLLNTITEGTNEDDCTPSLVVDQSGGNLPEVIGVRPSTSHTNISTTSDFLGTSKLDEHHSRPTTSATTATYASSVGELSTDDTPSRPVTPADQLHNTGKAQQADRRHTTPSSDSKPIKLAPQVSEEEFELRQLQQKLKKHKQKLYSVDFEHLYHQKKVQTKKDNTLLKAKAHSYLPFIQH